MFMSEREALAWVLLFLMTIYMFVWQRRYLKLQTRFSEWTITLINAIQTRVNVSHAEMERVNELPDESESSTGRARSEEAWGARESRQRERDISKERRED